jgi:hypothetical protein
MATARGETVTYPEPSPRFESVPKYLVYAVGGPLRETRRLQGADASADENRGSLLTTPQERQQLGQRALFVGGASSASSEHQADPTTRVFLPHRSGRS